MKLAIDSYPFTKRLGVFEAMSAFKNAGFDCVDLTYYGLSDDSPLFGEGYREYSSKLREHLDLIGLECNQAHAPFKLKYGDEWSEDNIRYLSLVRSIESASILGAKSITIHAIEVPDDCNETHEEYNRRFYRHFIPLCEKYGIKIAVENLFRHDKKRNCIKGIFGTPQELCRFIRSLDSPHFIACVDIGHAALAGLEPEEYILGMDSSLLRSVHIQDTDYRNDLHTLPYFGQFNWTAIMKAFKRIGYEGVLNFEVFRYFKYIPDELLGEALDFAESVGRHLISIFNEEC